MGDVLFKRSGEFYVPTDSSGSPWSSAHLHGGPVVGLLAHSLEEALGASRLSLARLTVDLLRPVPSAPLSVSTRLIRGGKRVQILEASLLAGDTEVARANALYLEAKPVKVPEYGHFTPSEFAPPSQAVQENLSEAAGWQSSYNPVGPHSTVKAVVVDGVRSEGQGVAWLKLPVPLVEGVTSSSTVIAATLCDFGNGVGQLNLSDSVGCINADVSLYLHRTPVGEWFGIDARSRMQDSGVGLVETTLLDSQGPVGKILQAIIPMEMPGAKQ